MRRCGRDANNQENKQRAQNEKLAVKDGDDLENEEIEPEDEQPEVRPQVAGDGQGRTRRTSTLTRRTSTLT